MKYILIADDEEQNRDILKEILIDDYEINCVDDGLECIKSIESRIPDLLLLDVSMPKMNGYEVCNQLRLNSETKSLPIVLLSGHASQKDINKGFEVGVNKYITKPFSPVELFEVVTSLLNE